MEDLEYSDVEDWWETLEEWLGTVEASEEDKKLVKKLTEFPLVDAIKAEYVALNATAEDHPDRVLHFHKLGCHLFELYHKKGSTSDLLEAIRIGHIVIRSSTKNHPDRWHFLFNLAAEYHALFVYDASQDDLEKSIRYAKAAVSAIPQPCPAQGSALSILLRGLLSRFLKTQSMTDLEEALRIGQATLDFTPEDHPNRAAFLSGHAETVSIQYRKSRSLIDLDKAITIHQAAINAADEDNPLRARLLNSCGFEHMIRYHKTGSLDDLQQAFTQFTESLYEAGSPEFDCLLGGLEATKIVLMWNDYARGAQFLTECLALFKSAIPRSGSFEDHLSFLRNILGLGSLAASVFLRNGGSAFEFLQALEKSQGVISSFLLDSRSDISMLEECCPPLYRRYRYLRKLVARNTLACPPYSVVRGSEWPKPEPPGGWYPPVRISISYMMKELEVLEHVIRKKYGFDKFQLPPTEQELIGLGRDGPIVIFNINHVGSDALLITENNLQVLPLPQLTLQDLQKHVTRGTGGNRCRRDAKLVSINGSNAIKEDVVRFNLAESMHWLWDVAVKPILRELGLLRQQQPPAVLPCLWWVGGGSMALLPLHAAGEHSLGSTENTMSHVVSSYAPTLKALQFTRKSPWISPTVNKNKILVIAMHHTPDQDDLNVADEIASIQQHIGCSASVEVVQNPTVIDVVEKIKGCSMIHFACHGYMDTKEPLQSALLLGKETVAKLTLEHLQSLDHQLTKVAYLSACSTAEIGAQDLVDESIHLASTFQLVGFRHVIGIMWGAEDNAAVAVAAKFYGYLLQQNADAVSSVPRALHRAVLDLKAQDGNCNNIELWAPFIHVGP